MVATDNPGDGQNIHWKIGVMRREMLEDFTDLGIFEHTHSGHENGFLPIRCAGFGVEEKFVCWRVASHGARVLYQDVYYYTSRLHKSRIEQLLAFG